MNILYISNLMGNKWTGPHKSVPNQIKAQEKYDNVMWFNLQQLPLSTWNVDVNFTNVTEIKKINIKYLPSPFNSPDLVIFQGVYYISYCKIAADLKRKNIPYIVIPRSSLTIAAQRSKKIKKRIGNLILFKNFIKNAAAIQFLTLDEMNNSVVWNKNSFVIPNGIDNKENVKVWSGNDGLRGVFIGRLDIYQKGLDLFLDACNLLQDKMREAQITIDIYGPDRSGSKKIIEELIEKSNISDLINLKDPIFDQNKETVLLNSDFFILTSRFEGHSMGLIEALSYGIPCLVTRGSNMGDEILKWNAGWSSETSLEGIIGSMMELIDQKDTLSERGNNAIKLSFNYDWKSLAYESRKVYRKYI
ncbi:glycosyltransferase [Paenibacillus protaetiae]|uniref:Glycosyltransferase n=1 Tax=Paenibacillus protaetiae TaxID=2509456 RepID=A0A4P6EZP0_9BACL|nr:glycosyltransferase [Paenibacillus protaetiae]QAY67783.1 glycosyltransferase [Paenibacillus protaetiae]